MDPELQAELESVMDAAGTNVLVHGISRDVDMIMMAEAHNCMPVKSILLSQVMSQGFSYTAGVLCTMIRKSQTMARLYALADEGHRWRIEHESDEDPGYRRAHDLLNIVSAATAGELVKVTHDLEDEIAAMPLLEQGKLIVHTVTLCNAMLAAALEVRSAQLRKALGLTEDEGDS